MASANSWRQSTSFALRRVSRLLVDHQAQLEKKKHKTTLLNSCGAGAWMGVSAKDQGGNSKEIRWNGWEQENKGGKNTGEKKGYK